MQLLRFLGFFEYFELFSLFILFIYFEVFFNVFQIMDFLDIFSCFEALSSTFGWFSHVFWIFSAKIFIYFGLVVFWYNSYLYSATSYWKEKRDPYDFLYGSTCQILRRLVFSLLKQEGDMFDYYTNTKTHIRYLAELCLDRPMLGTH